MTQGSPGYFNLPAGPHLDGPAILPVIYELQDSARVDAEQTLFYLKREESQKADPSAEQFWAFQVPIKMHFPYARGSTAGRES